MGWLKKIANSITGNSLIGAAAGAIGSLISGHQQQQSQERAAQLQFENWQKTYGIQRRDALADYERNLADQRQLMLDQAGIQKQGLINAGINPANQAGNMTLTAPNCTMADYVVQQVKEAIEDVPGVVSATIELVFDPVWDKSRMSEEALVELGLDED